MAGKYLKGVLFDLDGVLIDSYQAWYTLLNGAAREYGFPDIPEEKYKLLFGQSVEADIDILFPGMKEEDLATYFENHFFDHIETFRPIDGADLAFQWCNRHNLPVAVVTNTTQILAEEILKHLELRPEAVVGSRSDIPSKPAPDMVFLACEQLGIEPKEAVLIGDSDFDNRSAEAAGVTFIGYQRPGDLRVDSHHELRALLAKEFFLPKDNRNS